MSVNITVNGKFNKTCGKQCSILDDPVSVRKELEDERRKQRLKEVREESKNLARKIRNDVAAEKERQLRNLEAIKAQELDCWRKHVLTQKTHDYRSALFQVGAAHYAAKKENEAQAARQNEQAERYKDFRNNIKSRREGNLLTKKALQATGTQTPKVLITGKVTTQTQCSKTCIKQRVASSGTESDSEETETDNYGNKEQFHINSTSSSADQVEEEGICASSCICSSESSLSSSEESDMRKEPANDNRSAKKRCIKFCQNPSVMVEVDVNSNDSIIISCNNRNGATTNINESQSQQQRTSAKHINARNSSWKSPTREQERSPGKQTSVATSHSPRKRVSQEAAVAAQSSPRKRVSQQAAVAAQSSPRKRVSQQAAVVAQSSPRKLVSQQAAVATKRSPRKGVTQHIAVATQPSPRKRVSQQAVVATQPTSEKRDSQQSAVSHPKSLKKAGQKPRYTQVSDLIEKKKNTTTDCTEEGVPLVPPNSLHTESPAKSQRRSGTSAKTSGVAVTPSGATITLDSGSTGGEGRVCVGGGGGNGGNGYSEISVGRVQFYDYKNKYRREYEQPAHAVQAASVRNSSQPNAREQACIEKKTLQTRQLEIERMRCRSEERGQKALEREQVRRDCIALTEKLEALTKQYPQLLPPNDTQLLRPHQIAAQNARREERLNSVIEDILIRPAIITLPEVSKTQQDRAPCVSRSTTDDELNLGAPPAVNTSDSAESCSSLLLGYMDDQRKQLRSDLNECAKRPENEDKSARLRRLLQRIEQLRQALCAELQKSNIAAPIRGSVQHVIDGVSDVRRERERILGDEGSVEGSAKTLTGQKQRSEVEHTELLLEQKLRELCAMQNLLTKQKEEAAAKFVASTVTKNGNTETRTANSGGKPLEIVIRVKGDGRCSKSTGKVVKSPRKMSTLVEKNENGTKKRSSIKMRDEPQRPAASEITNRQNSYDSNSTSYRSLPPQMTNQVDNVVEQFEQARQQESDKAEDESEEEYEDSEDEDEIEEDEAESSYVPSTVLRSASVRGGLQRQASQLNPIIAHYVQRLLGMSRSSVQALSVDSSEIETPNSSVVNTSSNMIGVSVDETQERLSRVQQFIEDNRSFIGDLEETLRSQSNVSLETSMRMFEDIWQQRLRAQKHKKLTDSMRAQRGSVEPQRVRNSRSTDAQGNHRSRQKAVKDAKGLEAPPAGASVYQSQPAPRSSRNQSRDKQKSVAQSAADSQRRQPSSAVQKRDKSIETEDARGLSAERQIERYAQLTDNCTQRIAELTALINKVREEKQRLMEVTLSSVSDGRNSTEYVELPDGERRSGPTSIEPHSNQIKPTQIQRVRSPSRTTGAELPTSSLELLPGGQVQLEKGKQTGTSRDSGISMSRPMTAQDGDPHSQASTSSAFQQRKAKPPPTIQRYSPQLVRNEVAHELSTIVEVDTPITTRRPGTSMDSGRLMGVEPQAAPFPTFKQYARELNLDVTQLDADTTMRMQQEFDELVANLRAAEKIVPNYQTFPSLTAYLCKLTAHEVSGKCCQSPETIEDLLACLRLANLTIKSFPSRREYLRQRAADSPQMPLIDTTSLENITDTGTDSESMNIEKELMRRNILQRSFASTNAKRFGCTSTHHDGGHKQCRDGRGFASESGIDQLSTTSENHSGDLERDLLALGISWPSAMREKMKEAESRNGNSSSSASERRTNTNRAPSTSAPHMQHRGVHTDPTADSKQQKARRLSTEAADERRTSSQSPSCGEYTNRGEMAGSQNISPKMRQPTILLHRASPSPENRQSGTYREVRPQPHSAPHSPVRSKTVNRGAAMSPRSSSQSPPRNHYVNEGTSGGLGVPKPAKRVRLPQESNADFDVPSNPAQQVSEERKLRLSSRSSCDCDFVSDFGRPLNLRDFLTKELLKHVTSTSSSSTDDSLRSQFLQSIIESMTPRTCTGGTNNLERQKTSTPVTGSGQSRSTSTSSTSQLFSGESRISSVHYFEQQSLRYRVRPSCAESTAQ